MTETRGITCLQCKLLDLRTNPEAAKMSYGICKLDMKGVFVRFEMTRDCMSYQAADEDTVKARGAWAAKKTAADVAKITEREMNELYVRYFIETCEWWVCQDEGLACKKLSGPWREKLLADKAMTTIKMKDA